MQLHFSEVKKYDMSGNEVTSTANFAANTWYTVYVPITAAGLNYDWSQIYSLISQDPKQDGTEYKYADYWLRNVRFEAGLPTA